ncbi:MULTISPECIES: hypothetical protein [unclassified Streptomyces]|uniref:hypothetical protein n=1 Tax=unclassified Streptomyces TaxID=2593676 RepID=UPI000DC76ED0|nr:MULTISPECIES: hypothetical protein [unclassified Streptomyces]AWZ08854.1 hypothetical protein DRB89_34760 [Streptomyces sp. ICC4]AWZ16643.1 hypothetical protein DRB96_35635 [Streptomyces sp. ICC1]
MDTRAPIPDRRSGPHALTGEGIAALLARYEFGDACLRRVVLDQEYGPRATRGRVARLVIDARVVGEGLRWEPVSLDLLDVRRFRIDESDGFSWVLYDPPQFTRFDGLLQVDLCAERFGSLCPENAEEVFEGSHLVFAATGGTWSALHPWER